MDVYVFFEKNLDSQIKISSAEEVQYKLDVSFEHNRETNSELISEAVFRSGRNSEVDGSSFFISRAEVACGLLTTESSLK